jgi:hypothetical protein
MLVTGCSMYLFYLIILDVLLFREYFGNLELNDRIDPDITVAYGAASILD